MAIYIFHPTETAHRRADGIGFVVAEGVSQSAARATAANMIGAPGIDAWAAVLVEPGMDPVAVEGLPVGRPGNATWPQRTRGNRVLSS